jgi:cytochrome c553
MRKFLLGAALVSLISPLLAAEAVPTWAFYFPDAVQPPATQDHAPKQLPGSTRSYTQAQIDNLKASVDWFPEAHPPAPRIVLEAPPGPVLACGVCHLMSGMGHPESSSLAGLPAAYMEQQIRDFKSGARKNPILVNGQPQNNALQFMINIAKGLSDEDAHAASEWFAALKPIPWVRVEENATVPRSYMTRGYARFRLPGGGTEPIGLRIIELPADEQRELLRDPRSGSVAYVPPGSIAAGRTLATTGGGKTIQCNVCHGADLKGLGAVPGIAGRSPTYTFRQLYLFKDGSRAGTAAALMTGVVAQLTQADMISLSAYVATLPN